MLDIEYIKQIDEMLDVEGWDFHYKPHEPKLGGGYLDYYERRCSIFGLSMPNSIMYELYLVRVIEAINKDWTKEDSDNYYWICQNYDDIEVYEQSSKREVFTLSVDCKSIDECKEKAITYVMDHIKEKV